MIVEISSLGIGWVLVEGDHVVFTYVIEVLADGYEPCSKRT